MKPNISQLSKAKSFIRFTDEPKFHYFFCHHLNLDGTKVYGSSLCDNKDLAVLKSYYEAMERACLSYSNHIQRYKTTLSYNSSKTIVNEFLKPDFQISIDKIKTLKLCESFHYNTMEKVLLPNQVVFADYNFSNEPLIRIPISSGAAIGKDFASTFERAFLELIERDSFMLFWLTQKKPLRIDISSNISLFNLDNYLKRYLLDLYIFDISTDLGIPSIMAILVDYTRLAPAVSVGLKSSFDIETAIISSIFESLQNRIWLRYTYLQTPNKNNSFETITNPIERGFFWYGVDSIKNLDFILNISPTSLNDLLSSYKQTTFNEWFSKADFDI